MEFFYKVGDYENTKILGAHLYYSQEEFTKMCDELKQEYNEIWNTDRGIDYLYALNCFGLNDYLVLQLNEKYDIVELEIDASY